MIVEDPSPPPYSRDELWGLDDWLLTADGTLYPEFNTRHDLAHDGRWGNVATVDGRVMPRLEAAPGERVRLRLLNAANGRVFSPDFSGLDAEVIAVDGLYTARPLDPAGLEIAPGNRIDLGIVILDAWAERRFVVVDPLHETAHPARGDRRARRAGRHAALRLARARTFRRGSAPQSSRPRARSSG